MLKIVRILNFHVDFKYTLQNVQKAIFPLCKKKSCAKKNIGQNRSRDLDSIGRHTTKLNQHFQDEIRRTKIVFKSTLCYLKPKTAREHAHITSFQAQKTGFLGVFLRSIIRTEP